MPEKIKRPATVRVIRWQGSKGFGWGVDIDQGNGKHRAYLVGPQEAAKAEAERTITGSVRSADDVRRVLGL
jgi:hypothetical protein